MHRIAFNISPYLYVRCDSFFFVLLFGLFRNGKFPIKNKSNLYDE